LQHQCAESALQQIFETGDVMGSFLNVSERNIKVNGRFLRVGRLDGEKYCFLDSPEPVVEGLRKCRTRVDIFTFMQRLPETAPKYNYPMEYDNFAAIHISTFDNWWNKQIGFKARNKAKQAEKRGVILREIPFDDALVEGIWKIYNETPIRQGKRFPHFGMTLEQVRPYAATFLDQSVFIGAFFEDQMIGFIKMTMDETRTQAGLMHIVSMIGHRDKAPTNALVAQAVRACADRHVSYLVYSNFAYGKKEADSLSDFKERNGFQRIDIPRYYVPLTAIGRIALSFGLHRRFTDYIPEDFQKRLRDLRAAWYSRRMPSTEAL
jgi:hypothetical protein